MVGWEGLLLICIWIKCKSGCLNKWNVIFLLAVEWPALFCLFCLENSCEAVLETHNFLTARVVLWKLNKGQNLFFKIIVFCGAGSKTKLKIRYLERKHDQKEEMKWKLCMRDAQHLWKIRGNVAMRGQSVVIVLHGP